MMLKTSLLTIGNELLDGRVLNTNQQYLSQQCCLLGYSIKESITVNDDESSIIDTLRRLSSESHLIIITGGLGPTSDDMTAQCLAAFIDKPMIQFEEAHLHLKQWYLSKKVYMPKSNLKQTFFPESSTLIPNTLGTAFGCFVVYKETLIISLPGVPHEMKQMMEDCVLPMIKRKYPVKKRLNSLEFRCFGLGESALQDKINDLKLPKHVSLSYRVPFPEVIVKISSMNNLDRVGKQIEKALSFHIYSKKGDSFLEWIVTWLKVKKLTVSAAESCTGGLLSSLLISIDGASSYFIESVVTYTNESKIKFGVSQKTLDHYGAVSENVVKEMALQSRLSSGAMIGLSISGIAGPTGALKDKPVGTVCFGVSTEKETITRICYFTGSRRRIQERSAYYALWIMRQCVSSQQSLEIK
jgi:nicotinamide-nucleotide amidase